MLTYVRWRRGEPRVDPRIFPKLASDHPAYFADCIACSRQLGTGQPIQLIVLGPADDQECQKKHAAGLWYTAAAWIVHAGCLGAEGPDEDATSTRTL